MEDSLQELYLVTFSILFYGIDRIPIIDYWRKARRRIILG